MNDQRLDLRTLPVGERGAAIYGAFDELPPGATLTFVIDRDPRALMTRVDQLRPKQAAWEYRRMGEDEWHCTLTRAGEVIAETSIQGLLRRSFAFSILDGQTRATLAQAATERTARRGEVIVQENADFPVVGVLWDGVIALTSGRSSRERFLYEIFPYEIFAEGLFFDGGFTSGRLVALSKLVRYATIPRSVVREVGMQKPELLLAIGTSCAQRVRMLADGLTAQASQPILSRIASALVPFAIPERGMRPALAPLGNMTQAQLAAAAGTVKEVAARAIAELESRKALMRERGHIRYLDRARLLEIIDKS
ncbi:MAG: DUF2249 domain-containing protein [Vulcanimicrobiaceae bacterium]